MVSYSCWLTLTALLSFCCKIPSEGKNMWAGRQIKSLFWRFDFPFPFFLRCHSIIIIIIIHISEGSSRMLGNIVWHILEWLALMDFCWGWFRKKKRLTTPCFSTHRLWLHSDCLKSLWHRRSPPAPRAPRAKAKSEPQIPFRGSFCGSFFRRATLRFASLSRVARLSRVAWLEIYWWMILLMEELLH